MLEVRNITKIYNPGTVTEQRLFNDFSLTVEEEQFVTIVGGNGSGKTSLLNIICGSIPIEAGDVLVDGKSIAKLKDYQRQPCRKAGRCCGRFPAVRRTARRSTACCLTRRSRCGGLHGSIYTTRMGRSGIPRRPRRRSRCSLPPGAFCRRRRRRSRA